MSSRCSSRANAVLFSIFVSLLCEGKTSGRPRVKLWTSSVPSSRYSYIWTSAAVRTSTHARLFAQKICLVGALHSWCECVSVCSQRINIDASSLDLHSINVWKSMMKISSRRSTDEMRNLKKYDKANSHSPFCCGRFTMPSLSKNKKTNGKEKKKKKQKNDQNTHWPIIAGK